MAAAQAIVIKQSTRKVIVVENPGQLVIVDGDTDYYVYPGKEESHREMAGHYIKKIAEL